MTFIDAIHNYYAGQRMVGIAGALVPAAYLLIAWVAFVRATHPAHAFAITVFVLAGAFMLPLTLRACFMSAHLGHVFPDGPPAQWLALLHERVGASEGRERLRKKTQPIS